MPACGRERRQRRRFGRGDEAALLEVGAVHREDGRRAGLDGSPVVVDVRAVGGADFVEPGAAPAHDVRNSEGSTDLDELAARNQRRRDRRRAR